MFFRIDMMASAQTGFYLRIRVATLNPDVLATCVGQVSTCGLLARLLPSLLAIPRQLGSLPFLLLLIRLPIHESCCVELDNCDGIWSWQLATDGNIAPCLGGGMLHRFISCRVHTSVPSYVEAADLISHNSCYISVMHAACIRCFARCETSLKSV